MTRAEIAALLDTAQSAVRAASAASLRWFRSDVRVELKPDRTPVTAADRDAEAAIVRTIRERFPHAAILTEESGLLAGSDPGRWIVDPLDGTRGFSRGGSFWGPLVGFEHAGEVLAGAMALPALGATYWAARGEGSWRDGERLRVSEVARWEEATLSLGEPQNLLRPPHDAWVVELVRSAASVRCYGDLAGCALVLDGRAEAWLEAGVREWDVAALQVLVEEAGGRFSDFAGRRDLTTRQAIAVNATLADHVRRVSGSGSSARPG
ncbi:MAG TPA: inositol monophosphatase family protein [Candidatus Polarisedimenticolaceae bacterium]|nr:inositol monophosphatase family protein [Candidatus Polarisedimenticolaceae bacterium]